MQVYIRFIAESEARLRVEEIANGNFTFFLSTETGFGTVTLAEGKVSFNAAQENVPEISLAIY